MQLAERIQVTEDEYLAREREAGTKSELIDGEIVAMAGASPEHNAIASNVAGELRARLRDRPCLVFNSDQRVHVPATGLYTYPDVTVACGKLELHPKAQDTLLNPKVIVEVLSDATEDYDRGAKFAHYRAVPSLVEYAVVHQHARRVEHHRRLETGQWLLTDIEGDGAVLSLPTLGCEIPLAEIYAKVDLITAARS